MRSEIARVFMLILGKEAIPDFEAIAVQPNAELPLSDPSVQLLMTLLREAYKWRLTNASGSSSCINSHKIACFAGKKTH